MNLLYRKICINCVVLYVCDFFEVYNNMIMVINDVFVVKLRIVMKGFNLS